MDENKVRADRNLIVIWIVVILFVLTVGGYFVIHTGQYQKSAGPSEKVTIAYATPLYTVLAEVAQAKGYYLQEGLEVTAHLHSYGKPALDEVLEGKADFATVAETPVMFAIMGGGEISVIATIYTSNKDYAIIARKDKGISNPRDLEFRKVATSLGTSSEFFMDSFLAINGIARKNVIVVNLKPEELPDALINGDVAAASAFRPFLIYAQKKLGDRGILFYDQDIYTMTFNVVATQEYVRKNPEKVIKMLRALINAEEFVRQNPAEAQKIIADFNLIDRVLLGEMWDAKSYSVKLDQSLVLALEDQSLWAIKSNLTKTKKMPNYLDFIYSDGLKKVKPETVRILK